MKALVHDEAVGLDSLHLEEIADPHCPDDSVVVDVAAAGINRADLLQLGGHYPPPSGASAILGLEISGVISEVGGNVVDKRVGDRVCALLTGGGYASKVAVPATQVMPIPAGISLVDAAALPEVACTVWSTLVTAGGLKTSAPNSVQSGSEPTRVLIHGGTGGIGSHAIQLAVALGAKVAATAGSDAKVQQCRDFGAELAINYRTADFVDAVHQWTADKDSNSGTDLILDVIGAKYLQRNIKALAPDGAVLIIGLQGGGKAEVNLAELLAKRARVVATTLRSRPQKGPHGKARIVGEVVENVWPLVASNRIRPIVGKAFPFAKAADALTEFASGNGHGKFILTTGG